MNDSEDQEPATEQAAPASGTPRHAPADAAPENPAGAPRETAEEPAAQPALEEVEEALANAFADVRTQSADSALVTPDRWETEQIAPAGMDPAAFAQLVFDVIDANAAQAADEQDETAEASAEAEADAAAAFGGSVESGTAETLANAIPEKRATDANAQTEANADADGEGEEAPSLHDQVLAVLAAGAFALPTADIAVLEGTKNRYLYSTDFMTDSFAHWTYLALEDDKVATFVDIVREESRVYPRPMVYRALLNDPFRMTEDQVLDCWKTVQESEKFPDIASCSASNGDAYFYSSDYLSEAQAKALAEYYSVERWMNP